MIFCGLRVGKRLERYFACFETDDVLFILNVSINFPSFIFDCVHLGLLQVRVQVLSALIILMSKGRSKKSKNPEIPMFIAKLLQILEHHQNSQTVSWTSTGDSFQIKNISKFTEETLPSYFKHHNFASFIRQLNMYGFKKIRHPDGDNIYMNEHFKEGARHLLSNINRKIREDKEETLAIYTGGHNGNEGGRVGRQIQDLKGKQKNLEEMCKRFLVQNQRLLEENQNLVQKMDKESREKEKRLEEFLIYLLAQKNARAINGNGENGQLSITNCQDLGMPMPEKNSDATPLEILANSMDNNQHFKKMKNILNSAYNRRSSKRKDNYTIIPPKKDQEEFNIISDNDMMGEPQVHQNFQESINEIPPIPHIQNRDEDEKSFLSINDFINAEDYQDFNLEQSN